MKSPGWWAFVPFTYVNGQAVYMVWDEQRKAWVLPKSTQKGD